MCFVSCTIDMNIPVFEYIAEHLSPEECRQLVASLHFESYELPESLSNIQRKLPEDVSCINLLLKWNSGTEKWEGMGKTHIDVAHRLRQIGRYDLAEWLGNTVFSQLIDDIENSLFSDSYFDTENKIKPLIYADKKPHYKNGCAIFDFVLWVVLLGLVSTLIVSICRIGILMMNIVADKRKKDLEEKRKLLDETLLDEN